MGKPRKGKRPFSQATERSGGKRKRSGKRSTFPGGDAITGRGLSVTALEAMADNRSRTLGGVCPPRRISNPLPGSASPPSQVPGTVFNVPARLSASSRPPSRSREHDNEGSPSDRTRSGSRLLQPPLSGRKGVRRLETRDRPLLSQRVRATNPVQDGDRRHSAPLGQRGRLPSLHGPEGCVLPDPHPPLLQEVAPFRLGRDGPSVQSALLRTVNRPTGLHESVCNGVGLGPLSLNSASPVSGRLAGPAEPGSTSENCSRFVTP